MNLPLTISDLHNGLFKKEYSIVDLVNEYLSNIEKHDSKINSLITVSQKHAISKAKELDNQLAKKGKAILNNFPLFGVPVIHKDMYLTKGIRTTAGAKLLDNYIPQYNSTAVSRYDEAGAITLAKANQDAWAHGSSGENSDYGPTKNPWNPKYVPGGSSSGSASAMAANFCLVSSGTDTCGSIRLPANYCNVYGFKPTYGSVSRYGIVAMASSLDSIGHFARCVDDIKTVFNTTKGPDNMDATCSDGSFARKRNGKYVLGMPKEFFESRGLSGIVKEEIYRVTEIYKKCGFEIKEVSLPHTKYAISVYYVVQPAEVSSNLSRYTGLRFGDERNAFSLEAKRRIMLGSYVLSSGYYDAYYLKAMKVRTVINKEIDKVFQKVDALIAPVSPTPPFELGLKSDNPLEMYLTDIYAASANLSGIPALAIPSGFTNDGLPLGFQVMGPRFSEEMIFDIAKEFELATNYFPKVAKL